MARSMGGGGGRSGGGGGRSMGGGSRSGSRSFSGSGRSRGTSGGGPRRMSGSSSFGGGSHHSSSHHHHHHSSHHHHHHSSYHHPHHHHGHTHYRSSSSAGCSSVAAFFIVMIIVLAAMASQGGFGGKSGSNQKLNKPKYTGTVDSSNGYYIDDSDPTQGGFITNENESALNGGFKEFYNKTGVFPFLYIIENTPSKSEYSEHATYQDKLYEELFDSEGNLLILYIAEEDDYYFAAGYDIGSVIDDSAIDIICDRVNSYWSTGDLGKAFGYGLRDASKNIMAKSNGRVIGITIVVALALIVIIAIAFKWWKAKIAQKNKEQEDLERTLNTPLESFGSTPIDDLSKKYDDDPTNDPS